MHSGLWLSAVLSTSRLATLSLMGSTFAEGDPFQDPQVTCNTRRGAHRCAAADRGAEPPQHGQGRDCPPRRSAAEKTSAAQKAEIEALIEAQQA